MTHRCDQLIKVLPGANSAPSFDCCVGRARQPTPWSTLTHRVRLAPGIAVYHEAMTLDLFANEDVESLTEGIVLLRRYTSADRLLVAVHEVGRAAPPRRMHTPGGKQMSVAMTNCGEYGWVTDRQGYRYSRTDPQTGQPWPAMPEILTRLATDAALAAGFADFHPDVCLINRYEPGARLSLHQDRDEQDFDQPIVSVSLGLPATFIIGGLTRSAPKRHIQLVDGDVIVFGGASRLIYHGIKPLESAEHSLLGACRINLTFRKAA